MDLETLEKENESYHKQDAVKLKLLINLIKAYVKSDPAKSIQAGDQAVALAEMLNDNDLLAGTYNSLAASHKNTGNFDEAVRLLEKALSINRASGNDNGTATDLLELGDIARSVSEFAKSRKYLEESLVIFQRMNNNDGISRVYNLLGNVYLGISDFSASMEYYQKAIRLREQTGEFSQMAGTLSNLGIVYSITGDYPKSLEQFHKALSINEKTGNKIWMLANLGNIGAIYFELSEYTKALENFKRAYQISIDINNKYGSEGSLLNMGSVYKILSDNEKAMECFQEALKISKEIDDKNGTANCFLNMGVILFEQSDYKKAIEYFYDALKISEETGDQHDVIKVYQNLGEWFQKTPYDIQIQLGFDPSEKYTKAQEYLTKSLKISEEINAMKEQKESLLLLSELYEELSDFEKSFAYYKKYIEIRDNILGEESRKQVTRKEMQYEFDKKESLAKAEQEKKDALALKELQRQKLLRNSFIGGFTTVLLFAGIFFRQRNSIRKGKKLSDELLLNILPEEVAEELKAKGSAEAKQFEEVTVMFTDFKGFTQISERLTASELVSEIDTCFKAFDKIISKYNIEKIKTIGDSYMCAGGLPVENRTNATDVVNAALEIQKYMKEHLQQRKIDGKEIFEIRTGIHTGPVVAGIVGIKKFAYDIWGNTVNIASRMESSCEQGKVNISGATYELIKDNFKCTYRGKVEAKNIGMTDMYFVDEAFDGE